MDAHFGIKRKQWQVNFKKESVPTPKHESLDDFKAKYVVKKQCWFDDGSAEEIERIMRENRMKIERNR